MRRQTRVLAGLLFMAPGIAEAELTEIERRWVSAALPVLRYAQLQQLPVDIVVQPQATAGNSPMAMAYIEGRCKLVLSMRGNPQAQAPLRDVGPELFDAVVETITMHEIGHCWRHVHGAWNSLPGSAMPAGATDGDDAELARLRREMDATRREEAFADLVGLAWTLRQRPQQYAQVFRWLESQRRSPALPGSHHDTRSWLRLADRPGAFDATAPDVFEQALGLWQKGLDSL